jgi:hypothetical protein
VDKFGITLVVDAALRQQAATCRSMQAVWQQASEIASLPLKPIPAEARRMRV